MNLAHESVFRGKYLRPRRRKSKRWDQSFFVWPKMRRNIVKFCKLCENCQLTARGLVIHRVRITLSQENTDVVGKTWSGIGCRSHVAYCLCISLVDSCTRWGTVFLLISLSAIADIDGIVHKCRYRGLPSVFTIAIKEQVLRPIWQEFI